MRKTRKIIIQNGWLFIQMALKHGLSVVAQVILFYLQSPKVMILI